MNKTTEQIIREIFQDLYSVEQAISSVPMSYSIAKHVGFLLDRASKNLDCIGRASVAVDVDPAEAE